MLVMDDIKHIVENTSGEVRDLLNKLVKTCSSLSDQVRFLEEDNKKIKGSYGLLRKKLFGSASERLKYKDIPEQLRMNLFDEFELTAIEIELNAQETSAESVDKNNQKKKTKQGRKPLSPDLPRTIIEHDLPDNEKRCPCGSDLTCIGFDASEQLLYTPPKIEVLEHRTKKYCCEGCTQARLANLEVAPQFKRAKKPPCLIPKSFASPGLLAAIAILKFCDHMPLYRQEASFARHGVELSRQTMSQWMLKVGVAIIPLINLLQEYVTEYDVSFADETPLQVLKEPGRKATAKSYMWLFIGGPPDKRALIYQYHPGRSSDIPNTFFEDYEGALHCDGYSGYLKLVSSKRITGLNCWSHVRRKFLESVPKGKTITGIAGQIVTLIASLYQLEDLLRENKATTEAIKHIRQSKALPILQKIKECLDQKAKIVPPKSKLGKAIAYTSNRWPYLITYVDDGRYEIDNNRSERAIKPFVMGRKAWLFANSVAGANASCRLFSLIETAKANGLNPNLYLEYIFKELPNCKTVEDYEKLLPWAILDKSLMLTV